MGVDPQKHAENGLFLRVSFEIKRAGFHQIENEYARCIQDLEMAQERPFLQDFVS